MRAHRAAGSGPRYRSCLVTGAASAAAVADQTVVSPGGGSRRVDRDLMSGPQDAHRDSRYFLENLAMNCGKSSFTPLM
jgi:hypothetical protein